VKRFKSNSRKVFFGFCIIFCCEILFGAARAQDSLKDDGPTRIRSDIIDIKRKSQTINFLHNVVVEKGDSSLLADKMTVFYEEKSASKTVSGEKESSITRIDAQENVKIFSKEFVASGEFGYYEPKQDIFVLEKNVIVNNGTSIATGQKFVYNLTTKKGHFVGAKDETAIVDQGNAGADKRVVVIIGDDAVGGKKKNKQKNEQ
jgi:lipopolysaccharide transport protein LptA